MGEIAPKSKVFTGRTHGKEEFGLVDAAGAIMVEDAEQLWPLSC